MKIHVKKKEEEKKEEEEVEGEDAPVPGEAETGTSPDTEATEASNDVDT